MSLREWHSERTDAECLEAYSTSGLRDVTVVNHLLRMRPPKLDDCEWNTYLQFRREHDEAQLKPTPWNSQAPHNVTIRAEEGDEDGLELRRRELQGYSRFEGLTRSCYGKRWMGEAPDRAEKTRYEEHPCVLKPPRSNSKVLGVYTSEVGAARARRDYLNGTWDGVLEEEGIGFNRCSGRAGCACGKCERKAKAYRADVRKSGGTAGFWTRAQ